VILFDTNHVSILRMPPSERRTRLLDRIAQAPQEVFGIPIVVVEETMRGWLAAIAKERLAKRQISAYRELSRLFEFFASFPIALLTKRPLIYSIRSRRPESELPLAI
jgi:tRNA(fMet)-specific endonuclease VapC